MGPFSSKVNVLYDVEHGAGTRHSEGVCPTGICGVLGSGPRSQLLSTLPQITHREDFGF